MNGPIDLDPRILPLVPGYLEARKGDCRTLREAITARDWSRVGDIGHRLAGSGASYGFPAISEIGARLEAAVDGRAATMALRDLESAVEAALRAL